MSLGSFGGTKPGRPGLVGPHGGRATCLTRQGTVPTTRWAPTKSGNRSLSKAFQQTVALALLTGLAAGCAGYHLGPTNGTEAGDKTIQVNPFVNQTLQPRLTDAVTSQMRNELQRDGTYKLSTGGDADIVVTGALTTYQRQEITFASTDILTVRDFRLSLTARVTARERATGKELFNQAVSGYTLMRVGADMPSAERQAMPLLAADLAKNITALLAEGKW